MKKLLVVGLLCAAIASAQDSVQRVITIKNGNISGIRNTLLNLDDRTRVSVSVPDSEHLVLSGPKDRVSAVEEVIKQLDVSPPREKNVETLVYMIVATTQPNGANSIPSELDPVITQLKGIFAYKGFRLLDSFILRTRNGQRGDTNGFLPSLPGANVPASAKVTYFCAFSQASVDETASGRTVHFHGFHFELRVPLSTSAKGDVTYASAAINSDVDVPDGKKVVVGKTSAVEGSDSALILVISAKVVD